VAGPKILSLFSGVGGLEVAVSLAFRRSEVVGYVERDSYAATALMARMEEQSMDLAPIFCGEIQDLDGRELRGHVDVVCGGIPCQPYSVAGQQLGNEDDRALWEEFARIVGECEPALVFIENTPAFVTGAGFRPLGEELCRLGFEIDTPFFLSAAEVGAPHLRKRVYILAYRNSDGSEGKRRVRELLEGVRAPQRDDANGRDERLGGAGREDRPVGEGGLSDAVGSEVRVEPERGGGPAREAERRDPVSRHVGIFPPGSDDEDWGDVLRVVCHLAPATEPGLRFVVDGVPVVLDESRADQLRCAGNAVVVAQAYVAFRQLLQWIEKGEQ
jgi:DNA (cytosine-5)-methyltransferase 1